MTTVEQPCLGSAIRATAAFAGPDIWVAVAGGPAPHVGCVCLGVPRPSITGDGSASATVSTINATGHKDDIVANELARRLAARFGCTVSVTCGIHYERPDDAGLQRIMRDVAVLADKLEAALALAQEKA